jgi:hypothetical protein
VQNADWPIYSIAMAVYFVTLNWTILVLGSS